MTVEDVEGRPKEVVVVDRQTEVRDREVHHHERGDENDADIERPNPRARKADGPPNALTRSNVTSPAARATAMSTTLSVAEGTNGAAAAARARGVAAMSVLVGIRCGQAAATRRADNAIAVRATTSASSTKREVSSVADGESASKRAKHSTAVGGHKRREGDQLLALVAQASTLTSPRERNAQGHEDKDREEVAQALDRLALAEEHDQRRGADPERHHAVRDRTIQQRCKVDVRIVGVALARCAHYERGDDQIAAGNQQRRLLPTERRGRRDTKQVGGESHGHGYAAGGNRLAASLGRTPNTAESRVIRRPPRL